MHICKRTLTLLLTLCLAAATLPAVGLAADAGGSAAAEASEHNNPTTDEEIQAALETYDASIDDPEYQRAYERYQKSLAQDPDDGLQTYATGANPYTGKTYTHKHAKTKYIYDGIDVSKWQGTINWKKVKADGIDFAFIRCGNTSLSSFSMNSDPRFEENVKNAYAAGVKVGVYYYSGATSASEAKKEGNYVLNLVKPYKSKISLPVVMDYETNGDDRIYSCYKKTSKATRTTFVQSFCDILEDAGFDGGVYASKAWLTDFFNMSKLEEYSTWVAQWSSSTSYAYDYDFWQYSEEGEVNGISSTVDCNFWYTNTKISASSSSASTSSTPAPSAALTILTTYTTTAGVNYRTGCGTNYTKKGSVAKGKPVDVVYGWYKTVDGVQWRKVKINGSYYYMSGNYLKYETLVKYSPTIRLNYRTGTGTNYSVRGKLAKGSTIQIVKGWSRTVDGNRWYKVKLEDGSYYYVMAKYLTKKEGISLYSVKSRVNMRSKAGTDQTLKAKLMTSTPVAVVSGGTKTVSGEKWYKVKVGTKYYYIMARYLVKN